MKRTRLAVALGATLLGVGAFVAPMASAASGPLAGTWTSVDTDGSNQTLTVTGSGQRTYSMVYHDEAAHSACDGNPATLSGPGFVDGDTVVQVGALTCQPGGNVFRTRIAIGYTYDGSTDTLTDDFGIVWERAD